MIGLTAEERERVRDTILSRAAAPQARTFAAVPRVAARTPADYILDGPNIAYFKQNYEQGDSRTRRFSSCSTRCARQTPRCVSGAASDQVPA